MTERITTKEFEEIARTNEIRNKSGYERILDFLSQNKGFAIELNDIMEETFPEIKNFKGVTATVLMLRFIAILDNLVKTEQVRVAVRDDGSGGKKYYYTLARPE